MPSEIQKQAIDIKYISASLNDLVHRANDSTNMYISIASISSVDDDRTTCDLLLLDKNIVMLNVESIIPCSQLNTIGHLKQEDIVLVMYNYPSFSNANIIAKLNPTNKKYAEDEMFKVTNRLDFSKYAF